MIPAQPVREETPSAGATRPPRDPAGAAEARALAAAIEPYRTVEALRAAPEWPGLRARYAARLNVVRRYAPLAPPAAPGASDRVKLVQWNIEHGNWYAPLERALREHAALAGADVLTLNEVDLGMGRAGNRDVTGDLADALGLHGVFVPYFVESTAGRDDDARAARGRTNQESLYGVALLSRWPIGTVRLVPMPGPEKIQYDLERMVGRFVAVACEIRHPRTPFLAVSAHLEVHRTRAHRAAQIAAALAGLADETRPTVISGDFNTHTFDRGLWHSTLSGAWPLLAWPDGALRARLTRPDRGAHREPLFARLAAAGFAWEPYADFAPTLAVRFDRLDELHTLPAPVARLARSGLAWAERRARLRLDWIAARGFDHARGRGATVSGLDGPGGASDHAPVVAELALG